jgi:hypothetical protein
VFGPPPEGYLKDLGRMVDPRVDFFWTGEKVISEGYSAQHLGEVAAEIGRKPFIWDNYIANDSKTRADHLFLDPSTGSWRLAADLVAGLAINPMNQPYLSRIALRGYQYLLTEGPALLPLPSICQSLCGGSFTERLLNDIDLLEQGLTDFDADTRLSLLDRYENDKANPYAQDIAAWLRGEYVFDSQCLTT